MESEVAMYRVSLIHVPSRNIMLMIGGNDEECHWDGDINRSAIWRYSVESGLWEQMKDEQNKEFVIALSDSAGQQHAVLTSDERFVIIAPMEFAWYVDDPQETQFLVLDISDDDQYKLWKSPISMPFHDFEPWSHPLCPERVHFQCEFDAMMISGSADADLLTFGWIRKQSVEKHGGVTQVPMALMTLISHWCSADIIHCFGHNADGERKQHHLKGIGRTVLSFLQIFT